MTGSLALGALPNAPWGNSRVFPRAQSWSFVVSDTCLSAGPVSFLILVSAGAVLLLILVNDLAWDGLCRLEIIPPSHQEILPIWMRYSERWMPTLRLPRYGSMQINLN